jgi:hypothetical protein
VPDIECLGPDHTIYDIAMDMEPQDGSLVVVDIKDEPTIDFMAIGSRISGNCLNM